MTQPVQMELYRQRVWTHLRVAFLILFGATGLIALFLMTGDRAPVSGVWPLGTGIGSVAALQLSDAEKSLFDAAVLGDPISQSPISLAEPQLPAMVPSRGETLWISSRGDGLRDRARSLLNEMWGCVSQGHCNESMRADYGRRLVHQFGMLSKGSSLCDAVPYVSGDDKRVPLGLLAVALTWIPECQPAAIAHLREFDVHTAKLKMDQQQKDMAAIFAGFNLAKLEQDVSRAASADYLARLRLIRNEIVKKETLRQAYLTLEEMPAWGLSIAEIRAEWMLAEAREVARLGRGGLEERIAKANLFEPVSDRLWTGTSAGQQRLRAVWCSLAVRFGEDIEPAVLARCIPELAVEQSFSPALRCVFDARDSIRRGQWDPRNGSCDKDLALNDDAIRLLDSVASRPETWRDAMQRYETLADGPDKIALFNYLQAYASQTNNRFAWFRHVDATGFALLIGGVVLTALGWIWWGWAVGWRRRTLWRFLPPALVMD